MFLFIVSYLIVIDYIRCWTQIYVSDGSKTISHTYVTEGCIARIYC